MFFSMRRVTLCDGKNTCTRAKWITERLQTHVLQLTSEALGPSAGIAVGHGRGCVSTRLTSITLASHRSDDEQGRDGAFLYGISWGPAPLSLRCLSTRRIVCPSSWRTTGFRQKASMPKACAFSAVIVSLNPVHTMMGR